MEALVGRDTVNTMPEGTLDAFRTRGEVRPDAVLEGVSEADNTLSRLPEHGIALDDVTAGLLDDGLAAFHADPAKVIRTIESKFDSTHSAV